MNINIKYSIIIPVFNSQEYLHRCLDSVVNQTYKNIEIIIINDGSTDNSLHIIKQYAANDKRIVVIDKENEGIGYAYKDAIGIAKGDYIGFLDSDDYLELNAYEKIEEKLNGADMLSYCRQNMADYKDVAPIVSKEVNVSGKNNVQYHFFVHLKGFPNLLKVIKREFFKDITFLKQNIGIDDLLTIQIIDKINSLSVINDVLINVFFLENSVSRPVVLDEKQITQKINLTLFIIEKYLQNKSKYLQKHAINHYFSILVDVSLYFYRQRLSIKMDDMIKNQFEYNKYFKLFIYKYFKVLDIKLLLKIMLFTFSRNFYLRMKYNHIKSKNK